MPHFARIIADSISPVGVRLTTFEVTIPRIVLAEFNTHRVFSRNSASSRAIPVSKMLERVMDDPFIPIHWGKNQRGMQADEEVDQSTAINSERTWLKARDAAVAQVNALLELGIHKQIANRLLEPFMWHTILVTATEWSNFFHLRAHPDAQPEIRRGAELMKEAMDASTPREIGYGEWHLPLIYDEDREIESDQEKLRKISVGRCARVSYLTHDGKRNHEKDLELHDRLFNGGHMSPMEHVATPMKKGGEGLGWTEPENTFEGNFRGWDQYRKTRPNEWDLLGKPNV